MTWPQSQKFLGMRQMSYTANGALDLAIAAGERSINAQLRMLAGFAVSYMVRTVWAETPISRKAACQLIKAAGDKAGYDASFCGNYVSKVADLCEKLQAKMPDAPTLLVVRDADTAKAALDSMEKLFSDKNIRKAYHVTLWGKAEDAAPLDLTRKAAVAPVPDVSPKNASDPSVTASATDKPKADEPKKAVEADAIAAINAIASEAAMMAVIKAANERLEAIRAAVSAKAAKKLAKAA